MRRGAATACVWRSRACAAVAGLLWGGVGYSASGAPVLHVGEGGWVALEGVEADGPPPSDEWQREGNLWIGRLSGPGNELIWGGEKLPLAEAPPPPLAPGILPAVRNVLGPCVVNSLSVRFEPQIRAHRWSLVFPPEGHAPSFRSLALNAGVRVELGMTLEDVDSGRRWTVQPERMGIEGGMFDAQVGESRLYAGLIDDGAAEWHVVVARSPAGRRIVQGRIRTFSGPARRFRWGVGVRTGAAGKAVVQEELPPAVVSVIDGKAVAMFMDLAEPRRYRVLDAETGWMGLEFDLGVTRATGNFPRSATFSVEVEAWETAGEEEAMGEAAERLGGKKDYNPLPENVIKHGLERATVVEPSREVLTHPGGFRDTTDALHYLMFRMTGLFDDADWLASAFLCAAQDVAGQLHLALAGDTAVLAVNADPDLETVLELGQNRGRKVLERVRRSRAPAIWVKAAGTAPGLDHHVRALHLCDYPAVWEEGSSAPGVDLRHAETELLAALSCLLKDRRVCLLVSDAGPLAPFTTAPADALVCLSAEAGEMRRQRALAGRRPVVWVPEEATEAAWELARELDFTIPGKTGKE